MAFSQWIAIGARTQGLDAELIHHVLVILFRCEARRRRNAAIGCREDRRLTIKRECEPEACAPERIHELPRHFSFENPAAIAATKKSDTESPSQIPRSETSSHIGTSL